MITCPICEKEVATPSMIPGTGKPLSDDSKGDFSCPTYVQVRPGIRWCHYTRFTRHYTAKPSYTIMQAIIPPFEILWHTDDKSLEVEEFFNFDDKTHLFDYKLVYQKDEANYQDFLDVIKRFQNLRVFA